MHEAQEDKATLIMVQIIFRHGIRAPDHQFSYPGDPHANISFMPFGRGELTKEGRKQSYEFGKELRSKYSDFLGTEYYEGILEAQSSSVGRARSTMQLVLAGLFPPTEATKIDDELNWQPMPFNYAPLTEDPLLGKMIMQVVKHENHSQFRKSKNSIEVIKCIEEKLNWKIKHFSQCLMIYDIIKSQMDLGFAMPEWAKDIYPEKLKEEVQHYMRDNFKREGYLRQGAGNLIKHINDNMQDIIQGTKKSKIVLYSGHDVNIIALLQILKFQQNTFPNYMASLSFELHEINAEYFVKVIFIDGYNDLTNISKNLKREEIVFQSPSTNHGFFKLSEFTSHVQDFFPL